MPDQHQQIRARHLGIAGVLCLISLLVFKPLFQAGFINFDDPLFILENPRIAEGLTWSSFAWAFQANFFHYTPTAEFWEPLVLITRLMDVSLFGMKAGGHHFTSVLLHVINVLLLYWALFLLTGRQWSSAVVAGLFAVHPLNVEPVAWLSARKDIVCGTFSLLTFVAYAIYACRKNAATYCVLAAACALAAMTKSMTASIPLLLLLLDYWPLHRTGDWRKLVLEKIPLFAISFLVCVLAWDIQRHWGAMHPAELAPLGHRLMNVVINYGLYLSKMFWPVNLSIVYQLQPAIDLREFFASALVVAILTAVAILARKRLPWLFVGWFWFVIAMLPVIGFVPFGSSRISDRYMYVPMIGLLVAAVWSIAEAKWTQRARVPVVALLVLALGLKSHTYSGLWKNSTTIFAHAHELYPGSIIIELQLALGLQEQGNYREAIDAFHRIVESNASDAKSWFGIGKCLDQLHQPRAAVPYLERAVKTDPAFTMAFVELGTAQAESGKPEEALKSFDRAIRLYPLMPDPYYRKVILCARMRRWPEAIESVGQLLRLQPENPTWLLLAAHTYHASGDDAGAMAILRDHRAALSSPQVSDGAKGLEEELSRSVK